MNEPEPDPRLLAALRHAPDADVQAPAALREAILGRARQAVAPAPQPGLWQRWQAAGSAPVRWGASGAFATVVLAGMITLLWRDDTPGPATETRVEAPVTTPQATSSAPAVVALAAPKTELKTELKTEPAWQTAKQAVAPPLTPPLEPPASVVADAQLVARERRLGAAAPAPVQTAADNTLDAARQAPAPAPAPVPEPAPAALTSPRAEAATTAALPAAPPAAFRAPGPAQRARERIIGPPWGAPPQPDDSVQWQPPQPGQPPAAQWLQQMAEHTAGPWQPAPGAAPPPGTPTVRWQRGGQLFGLSWIETHSGARWWVWCADSGCQKAPLKEEAPR